MMSRFFKIEFAKYRRSICVPAAISMSMFLLAAYFFSIVGRFDSGTDSTMFHDYSFIIGLSFTVALVVVAVYSTVVYAKRIVEDYIGDRRILLYRYAAGRRPLFLAKNAAFIVAVVTTSAIGLALGAILFEVMELLFPVSTAQRSINTLFGTAIGWVVATLSSISIALLSGLIGIHLRSTIAAVVSSIVLVSVLGNGIAVSLSGNATIAFAITLAGVAIVIVAVFFQAKKVEHDEVL